jgi:hypothetical protein
MRRIITLTLSTLLVALALATGALPAVAQSYEAGPVGQRELPNYGSAYCDNFYDGPPTATTPAGGPIPDALQGHVYWCYPDITGYWVATSPTV